MSKKQKLLRKFLANPPPKDFHWNDLETLLGQFGFKLDQSGGGSHVSFLNDSDLGKVIFTYRPHPDGILRTYQIREIRELLNEWGMINYE